MTGGLMQIVASGAQDVYLTGNPQITFFKVVYRRHTNFSLESIQQFFRNDNNLNFGKSTFSVLERKADLISGAVLQITLPALKQVQPGDNSSGNSTFVNWVDGIGNALINSLQVKIGGYTVDTQSGEWMDIYSQYNVSRDKRTAYNEMLGYANSTPPGTIATDEIILQIPLNFWFCNPGLALPIEALQYHDVELYVTFSELANMIVSDVPIANPVDINNNIAKFVNCKLYIDYIYLDTEEKRRTAQTSHEYLIEQVQILNPENIYANDTSRKIDLFLKHPVKSLYWVISNNIYTTPGTITDNHNQPLLYAANNSDTNKDTFDTMKLIFNGSDRFSERNAKYFRLLQPFQYFKCCPIKYVYTYTFSLRPFDQQPSGSCNFSRIDNVKMYITFDTVLQTASPSQLKVYAVNYNILRIMNGMSSVVFS